MVGLFVVAAMVTLVAIVPALALGGTRRLASRRRASAEAGPERRMLPSDGSAEPDLIL